MELQYTYSPSKGSMARDTRGGVQKIIHHEHSEDMNSSEEKKVILFDSLLNYP